MLFCPVRQQGRRERMTSVLCLSPELLVLAAWLWKDWFTWPFVLIQMLWVELLSPQNRCWSPNLHDLRMWPYSEVGSLGRSLRWSPNQPDWCPYTKGKSGLRDRHAGRENHVTTSGESHGRVNADWMARPTAKEWQERPAGHQTSGEGHGTDSLSYPAGGAGGSCSETGLLASSTMR